MIAATVTLPDAVSAEQAGLWPELVTIPALIEFREGTSLFVQCYPVTMDDGARMPIAHLMGLRGTAPFFDLGMSLPMLRGMIAALQAAERDLIEAGAVSVL